MHNREKKTFFGGCVTKLISPIYHLRSYKFFMQRADNLIKIIKYFNKFTSCISLDLRYHSIINNIQCDALF